jgi:hypothetical protein
MSSTLRYYNQIKPLTKLESLSTPSYLDTTINGGGGGGTVVPIPFSYKNGVLDINIQDGVLGDLITTGILPEQIASNEYKAKEMGGTGTVFSIGPNLRTWLENVASNPAVFPGGSSLGRVEVQSGGVVTKAQLTLDFNTPTPTPPFAIPVNNFAGATTTFSLRPDKPTGDQYVYGTTTNNYFTSWIFKTPVVLKLFISGPSPSIQYLSLYSNWTQV